MVGISRISIQKLSFRSKTTVEKRTILVGLKSDNHSRDVLLRLLTLVVKPKDNVLAIHVQSSENDFDPNTFHIHEDLCKSKQVDFQIKICGGDSYIQVLTNQVRLSYATVLVLGSRLSGPKVSALNSCLKLLPPTCTLIVINNVGRVLLRQPGTSQQGSRRSALSLRPSLSAPTPPNRLSVISSDRRRRFRKSLTAPTPSRTRSFSSIDEHDDSSAAAQRLFRRLSILESSGDGFVMKHFSAQELRGATSGFSPIMAIGGDSRSVVYRAFFQDGRIGAVRVLKSTSVISREGDQEILREIDLISRVRHENVAEIIGYCDCGETQAIVYDLSRGSLRQNLRELSWSERMGVALGVAKALNFLHHCCEPPIVHRRLNSSNILLSDDFHPQLSDFGSAIAVRQSHQSSIRNANSFSFGNLAPEYMMYGRIDEKIDVYSYGVVLLELITGKEAGHTQTDKPTHESLVLWARSMLSYGFCERLVDPYLHEDYDREEMKLMMVAARLSLMHSSSRRPTMKTILRLFEEPEYWFRMQREKDEFLNGAGSKCELDLWRRSDSVSHNMEDI